MSETSQAMTNQQGLDQLFQQALSPANNFISASTSLAIGRQREQEAQIREIMATRQQQAFQAEQNDANRRLQITLAHEAQSSRLEEAKAMAQFNQQLQREDEVRKQAILIREDEGAQRMMGSAINDKERYPSTPEGDAKLVRDFHKAVNPHTKELMAAQTLASTNGEILRTIDEISKAPTDPIRTKAAIQKFLADPIAVDALMKKGGMQPNEIQALMDHGTFSDVSKAIQDAARKSGWFGNDTKLATALTSAFTGAQAEAGAQSDPITAARINSLGTLLKAQSDLIPQIKSQGMWEAIHSTNAPKIPQASPFSVSQPASFGYSPSQSQNGIASPTAASPVSDALIQGGIPGAIGAGLNKLPLTAYTQRPPDRSINDIIINDTIRRLVGMQSFFQNPSVTPQQLMDQEAQRRATERPNPLIPPF